jgi:hypothetical protein
MKKSVGLSLVVVAALLGLGTVSVQESGNVATPFWQLHGAAPAAVETDAIAELRHAARAADAEPGVVAAR